ncbi:MAG: hypothetical protein QM765_26360 [Myxococcales bacterium]
MLSLAFTLFALATPGSPDGGTLLPERYASALRTAFPELDVATGRLRPKSDATLRVVEEVELPGRTVLLLQTDARDTASSADLVSLVPDGKRFKLGKHLDLGFGDGPTSAIASDWALGPGVVGMVVEVGAASHARVRRMLVVSRGADLEVAFEHVEGVRCETTMVCDETTSTFTLLKSRANGFAEVQVVTATVHSINDSGPLPKPTRTLLRWDGQRYRPAQELVDPRIKLGTATSILKEQGVPADFYGPDKAFDGVPETAWVEGVKGPGIGEALTLELTSPARLQALSVLAGCGTTPALWRKNHRIKALLVSLDGRPAERFELEDVDRAQRLALPDGPAVAKVRLEIAAVYPGSAFDDACLSEVHLEAGP